MTIFDNIVSDLSDFQLKQKIFNESEFESLIEKYLEGKGWQVQRQKIIIVGRNDLVIHHDKTIICLEVKKNTNMSIVGQIGKYLGYYDDGIIVICWKASKELKSFIEKMNKSQKWPPLKIIEVIKNQGVF